MSQQLRNREEIAAFFLEATRFYASGTWTPTFAGTGTAGTFTYTANRYGRYVRMGQVVTVFGRVIISAISVAPTGVMLISGLPFTPVNTSNQFGTACFGNISNFNYAAGALDLCGLIQPNEAFIRLIESFDNAASASTPAANFTNAACDLIFTASYLVE
jgi:hypothetical protein